VERAIQQPKDPIFERNKGRGNKRVSILGKNMKERKTKKAGIAHRGNASKKKEKQASQFVHRAQSDGEEAVG